MFPRPFTVQNPCPCFFTSKALERGGPMFLSSAIITVHLENLRHNLKTLLARHPSLMPVIKADAYGHGVVAVARVLAEEGIQHMAVGSVGEGALLRQEGHTASCRL